MENSSFLLLWKRQKLSALWLGSSLNLVVSSSSFYWLLVSYGNTKTCVCIDRHGICLKNFLVVSDKKQWRPSLWLKYKMETQQRCLSEEAKHSSFDATDYNSSRKSALGKKQRICTSLKTSYCPDRNFCMTTGESLAHSQMSGDLFWCSLSNIDLSELRN